MTVVFIRPWRLHGAALKESLLLFEMGLGVF
jgi:hypothetical protein